MKLMQFFYYSIKHINDFIVNNSFDSFFPSIHFLYEFFLVLSNFKDMSIKLINALARSIKAVQYV